MCQTRLMSDEQAESDRESWESMFLHLLATGRPNV